MTISFQMFFVIVILVGKGRFIVGASKSDTSTPILFIMHFRAMAMANVISIEMNLES